MKLKENWKKLKEAWKDRRKRAIIKLGLYFIFFIIVIAMIKGNNTGNIIDDSTENIDYSNYNFNLNYNGNEIINGVYDNGIVEYNYDNQKYYINDGITYQIINNELINVNNHQIHIDKLIINNLNNYIDESIEIYTTEFNDGRTKKGYEINIEDFAYLYNNQEITDKNKINISVTYLFGKIVEIEYDLTLYFKNYYNIENNYVVKITFNSFNETERLNLNFNK